MARLWLDRLVKSYGRATVVRDLSLTVQDGEVLCLLGPSGCGKTTTLRMIAGLAQPDSGRIMIGERDVTTLPPRDRRVGMMFQGYALYPHMTVLQNIGYPLKVRHVPTTEWRERATETAELLGLTRHLGIRVPQLSGGQQQRVALGRAMVQNPDLFLLDEPISALDARMRGQMREEIRRLQRRLGTTTIIVSHDQLDALGIADQIAVMRDGVVEQFGTPDQVYNSPANVFVASFLGEPPMNLINGRLKRADGELALDTGTGYLRLAGTRGDALSAFVDRTVTLGFRPQDVLIVASDGGANGLPAAQVAVAHRLGSDALLEVDADSIRFRALVNAGLPVAEGQTIWWQLTRVHAFAADGGEALTTS